ncbi:MAG: DUF1573 domain-containing protein [Nitrospinae bacterium]|nr:DUF1573 domain-containing protein [Nitrospinota bacterium]
MTGKGRHAAWLIAALLTVCSTITEAAGLVFEQTAHNFGRIQKIEPLTFTFSFQNTSAAFVTIANVSTSCGCTAAKPEKTEYQPGEKGTIVATFNPAGHAGLFESTISVEEGGGARHILTLAADIETLDPSKLIINLPDPVISVTPDKVHLGTFKMGGTALFKVIVENKGDGDLYLRGGAAPNEAGVRLNEKAIKKGKKIELTLFYKPEKSGKIDDFVVIRSNDPKNPELKIHLTGKALKPKKRNNPK